MRRLPDNPAWIAVLALDEPVGDATTDVRPVKTFCHSPSPKALAWMAALCAATGRMGDAEAWLVELIGEMLLMHVTTAGSGAGAPQSRHTVSMS
jgi:hypothetical protein